MFNFSNVAANTEEEQQSLSLSKEEVSKGDYIIKYDEFHILTDSVTVLSCVVDTSEEAEQSVHYQRYTS